MEERVEIPKPTEADKAYFRSIVPADPRVEVKPMFGNLGAFVNGNMFMGLFGGDVGVKLAPADAAALLAVDGAGPFGPAERPMGGYVSVPAVWRESPSELTPWAAKALTYVAAMPAKKPKVAKSTR
jgi:TfoX/Sxy family transcriptional regulator of competence genes